MTAINRTSTITSIQSTTESSVIEFDDTNNQVFNSGGATVVGLLPDEDWTGTSVTCLWSLDGVTYSSVQDITGTPLAVSAVTSEKLTLFAPTDFLAFQYIKFISNATETATMQVITRSVV